MMSKVAAVAPHSATTTWTSADIAVMRFLFGNPLSNEKSIMKALSDSDSNNANMGRAALHKMLDKLRRLGVIMSKSSVLFSLTDLGKVVIGMMVPNSFLTSEIVRRGLPIVTKQSLSPTLAQTKEPESSGVRQVNKQDVTTTSPGKVDMKPLTLTQTAVSQSVSQSVAQGKKENNMVEIVNNVGSTKALTCWCFTDAERDALLAKDVSMLHKDNAGVKSLLARGLMSFIAGKLELTERGKRLAFNVDTAPMNTDLFGLTRLERLAIELMTSKVDLRLNKGDFLSLLEATGSPADEKTIEASTTKLCNLGLIAKKSTGHYMVNMMLPLLGMRPLTKRAKELISGLTGGSKLLEIVINRQLMNESREGAFAAAEKNLPTTSGKPGVTDERAMDPANLAGDKKPQSDQGAVNDATTSQVARALTDEVTELADAAQTYPTQTEFDAACAEVSVGDTVASDVPEQVAAKESAASAQVELNGSATQKVEPFSYDVAALTALKEKLSAKPCVVQSPLEKADFLLKLSSLFESDAGGQNHKALLAIAGDLQMIAREQSAR